MLPGRHDPAKRRKSLRRGRERGCWIYIPAEQLVALGVDLDSDPPWYRTWGRGKRKNPGVVVTLYREP
jgi:hypothetical protein